ncbi:hypothetical protein BIV04_14185 [Frigoribacterium sp. MCBA15_019]|nr:hypothetical protein BIV04_14185 [Frigoribacterium sp. MCBA15_019]
MLAVVDDLVVHPASYVSTITETDTARRVSEAIQKITARGGAVSAGLRGTTVTLTGHVGEARQLIDLREAVAAVDGVKFVINTVDVTVPPPPNVPEVRIREGMARHGALDAEDVHVAVTGTDVTLTGRVSSWAERDQAATTAWSLPHVTRVINRITVSSWYPIPTD